MKIVTAAEMREIDRLTTEQYGVPSLTLMENAGTAVAEFAQKHFDFNSVCVVCGKGNNGGDGFVAARKLHEAGRKVVVLTLASSGRELKGDAAKMFKKLKIKPLWISKDSDFKKDAVQKALQSDLVIDAILGTGFKPPLQDLVQKGVEIIKGLGSPVVAVDMPSGADADSFLSAKAGDLVARADAVITFTAPKPAHVFGRLTLGPMAVADIGSPGRLVNEYNKLALQVCVPRHSILSPRPPESHKGDFGHVLVIGGSVGKAGAPALAGIAALRSGAGLVTVACPKSVQPTIAAFTPEIMTEPLPETATGALAESALEGIEQLLQGKDAVVLGPGLSRHTETGNLVRKLLPKLNQVKIVLDADGLNAFAGHPQELRSEGLLVLTPHPGEMSHITGISIAEIQRDRLRIARQVAKDCSAIVVLKGHRTLTASPNGEVWVNMSGNPGMAKGGSGDVLAGILGALLARRLDGTRAWRMSLRDVEAKIVDALRQNLKRPGKTLNPKILESAIRKRAATEDLLTSLRATLAVSEGVYLHGLSGDIARELNGESSMIATDIIGCIGEALAVCRAQAADKFIYLQR